MIVFQYTRVKIRVNKESYSILKMFETMKKTLQHFKSLFFIEDVIYEYLYRAYQICRKNRNYTIKLLYRNECFTMNSFRFRIYKHLENVSCVPHVS